MKKEDALLQTGNFIHSYIQKDLAGQTQKLVTRFPPEPNGYLHIGHAKSICLNFGLAELYGGTYNLRFDDTNPEKEDDEFVKAIIEDINWLGFDIKDRTFFGSDYSQVIYMCAVQLIKKGKAYVCDLTAEEIREYRGTLTEPGKESPYRNRSIEENLSLFKRMKNGEFQEGEKTLRAKIKMDSPNLNMRDPVMYRIMHVEHHRTKDKWVIYPMYDFAHPLQDAIEGITHSLCTDEFEDHRPLYNWFVRQIDFPQYPRQIEFAKLQLTNTIMGKRFMMALVESKEVDGWNDPRMMTLSGIRRRGVPAKAIRNFMDHVGVSKAESRVDIEYYEFFVREELQKISIPKMAVLEPLKVTITNYPKDEFELLEMANHPSDESFGTREVPFGRTVFIEQEDFLLDPPKGFHRLSIGVEVRLRGAYFIKCHEVVKDDKGNVIELLCTYDPETKSGSGFTGRKVKSTIHWVAEKEAVSFTARSYDYLIKDNENAPDGYVKNENTITTYHGVGEPSIKDLSLSDKCQFIRKGYFCLDSVDSNENDIVFNEIVPLRSSYTPPKNT